MFEGLTTFFKRVLKQGPTADESSKDTAKERLHLVLMQDRANVSADFLDLMKQEIIDVIKKYIEVDEKEIDVRLTNKANEDGTTGAPALYANIPIVNIKNDLKAEKMIKQEDILEKVEENKDNEVEDEPVETDGESIENEDEPESEDVDTEEKLEPTSDSEDDEADNEEDIEDEEKLEENK